MACGYDGSVKRGDVLELNPVAAFKHVRFDGALHEFFALLEWHGWRREGAVFVKAVNRREEAGQGRFAGF